MTIELSERTVAIWFIQLEPDQDWLASVYTTEEGEVKAEYRFRYYVDDKSFGSDDKKSWYSLNTSASVSQALEIFREAYNKLSELSSGEHYEILMDETGIDGFMEKFKQLPFFNGIELSTNEAKWMGYIPMDTKDG